MRSICLITLLLISTACGAIAPALVQRPLPSVGYRYLELLRREPFDDPEAWRSYDGGADLWMAVEDGAYRMELNEREFVWAQTADQFRDVAIEAELTQLSDFDHNAFGVACRLDPGNSGRGYYFLMGGDGTYTIRWSNGRSLEPIVAARNSDVIKRGRARNRMRAVCIEDYLALWINDSFVAEARDQRATEGAVGLAAVMNYSGRRLAVRFDDLEIWGAALEG